MPRYQTVKGNPGEKLYLVYDNFSGGMNTQVADNLLLDNEFRYLQNIELMEQGYIKNRKGFGYCNVFNDIIANSTVMFPTADTEMGDIVYSFRISDDTSNLFVRMLEYDSLEDFQVAYTEDFSISFIVLWKHSTEYSGVYLYLTKYTITQENEEITLTSVDHTIRHDSLAVYKTDNQKLMGVQVVEHNGYIYYNISKIKLTITTLELIGGVPTPTQTEEAMRGIIKYDPVEDTVVIIDSDTAYIPNTYEATNIGFNIIAENPLEVTYDESSVAEVRGVFLTDVEDDTRILTKIPNSGNFMLNVLYRGSVETAKILKPHVYVEDSFGTKTELSFGITNKDTDLDDNIGILKYSLSVRLNGATEVFVGVHYYELAADACARTDDDLTDLVSFFTTRTPKFIAKSTTGSVAHYNVYVPDTSKTYGYTNGDIVEDTATSLSGTSIDVAIPANDSLTDILKGIAVNDPSLTFQGITGWYKLFQTFDYTEYLDTVQIMLVVFASTDYRILPVYFDSDSGAAIIMNFQSETNLTYFGYGHTYTASDLVVNEAITAYEPNILDIYRVLESEQATKESYATLADFPASGNTSVTYIDLSTSKYYNWDTSAYVELEYTLYKYNGETDGSSSDFDEIEFNYYADEVLNYIVNYYVGTDDTDPVETFVLENVDMMLMGDRLALYRDNVLVLSDAFNFSYFPNYNYITFALNKDDNIQKIAYFRGSYMLFTKQSIYRISGEYGDADFKIVLVNDAIGCIAPDSVRSVNNTLLFFSVDGLYALKQNYYETGLENVDKVDKNINGLIPLNEYHESLLYNEQYLLFIKDVNNTYVETLKQYYNLAYASKTYPYVIDVYSTIPDNIFKIGTEIYSIKNGFVYVYDKGYMDFPPETPTTEDDYAYYCKILTGRISLGYQTNDKKFKSVYIKTFYNGTAYMYVNVMVDDYIVVDSATYRVVKAEDGSVYYLEYDDPTTEGVQVLQLDIAELGNFDLGESKLGDTPFMVNKVNIGSKGKTIQVMIGHKSNDNFGIVHIGYLYKLGKVKESV